MRSSVTTAIPRRCFGNETSCVGIGEPLGELLKLLKLMKLVKLVKLMVYLRRRLQRIDMKLA